MYLRQTSRRGKILNFEEQYIELHEPFDLRYVSEGCWLSIVMHCPESHLIKLNRLQEGQFKIQI